MGKWKHFVIVSFFLVILILNTTSLSATSRISPYRAFADDCYDSDGNYICTPMSDGSSNSDSGDDSSDGDRGGESSDSGGNSNSDGGDSQTEDNSGDSSDSNPNQGFTNNEQGNLDNSNSGKFDDNTDSESDSDQSNGDSKIQTDNGPNSKPVADAGPDLEVDEGDKVVLDGSSSKDSDGTISTYSWNQIDGSPSVDLNDADSSTASFTAPNVDSNQQLVFHLSVSDNDGSTDGDSVNVLIRDASPSKNQENTQTPTQSESDSETSEVTPDKQSTPPDNNQSIPNEQEQTNTGPIEVPKADQKQKIENKSNSPETTTMPPDCTENQTECNTNRQQPGEVDCMDSNFANASECNSSPPITPCVENDTSCNPSELPPSPCNGNVTEDGCNPENPPNPCVGNMTDNVCEQPNTGSVPCDESSNFTSRDCPSYSNPEPKPCNIYGNMTNATSQECIPNPNPGLIYPLLNSTTPNMTKLTINNSNSDNLLNLTLPNLNRTEISFQNESTGVNVTLPLFQLPEIILNNQTVMGQNLTGLYYENGTIPSFNDTLATLSNGTILNLTKPGALSINNIVDSAKPIYSDSISNIKAARDIASTVRFIGGLADFLNFIHGITCNKIIPIYCVEGAEILLGAVSYLKDFLNDYDFDKAIGVFQTGENTLYELDNNQDNKTLIQFGKVNAEAIQWINSLNKNNWVKSSKGFAATIGDIVIFAGKIKGDNNWIQTGQKIKTLHDDLVQDSSGLFKIQNMIKSFLGKQAPPTPKQPPHSPPIIKPNNPPNGDKQQIKKKTTTVTTTSTEDKPEGLSYFNNYGLVNKIGTFGTGPGQFNHPASIASDPNGQRFYVSDLDNNRIQVVQSDGDALTSWGTLGAGKGQFDGPGAVAVDDDHKLVFVSDIKNNRIEKFDIQGKFLGQWGILGRSEKQFDHPGDIALDPEEEKLYVTDIYNNRIQAFYYDGNFFDSWGTFGLANGQFNRPAGITMDAKDNLIYVSDTANNRIQVFDTDGKFVKKWGSLGLGNGQFARPDGIFFEPSEKLIYVADRQNHRIQVFDDQGRFVAKWDVSDNTGNPVKPRDIVIDPSGRVYVIDKAKSEIDVFGTGPSIQKTQDKTTTTKTTTTKTSDNNGKDGNNGKSGSQVKKNDPGQSNNDPHDKSETNPNKNDPCNYYGLDVCDKDRNGCDNHHFDCLTDLKNGDYCTTGMCPSDDDKVCWVNQKYVGCKSD